jgi:hypothetical protein
MCFEDFPRKIKNYFRDIPFDFSLHFHITGTCLPTADSPIIFTTPVCDTGHRIPRKKSVLIVQIQSSIGDDHHNFPSHHLAFIMEPKESSQSQPPSDQNLAH